MLADLRVLVIDDNVDAAAALTALLQALGLQATSAFGGDTGVHMAKVFKPDLVFMDLEMPGLDGCDVMDRIKSQNGPESQAMFVCVTGSSAENVERDCLEAGFDHFVRKPMDPARLSALLGEVGRRQRGAPAEARLRMQSSASM